MRYMQAQPVQSGRGAGLQTALRERLLHVGAIEPEPVQPLRQPLDSPGACGAAWQGVRARRDANQTSVLSGICCPVTAEGGEGAFDRRPLLV